VVFFVVRGRSFRAQNALCSPPLIVIFRRISPALLHGLLHFPSPNTKLVDEVGLAGSPALTKLSIRNWTGYAASAGKVADQKRSVDNRSSLPQAWESAIMPKSRCFLSRRYCISGGYHALRHIHPSTHSRRRIRPGQAARLPDQSRVPWLRSSS
jgi:hypothetical protein